MKKKTEIKKQKLISYFKDYMEKSTTGRGLFGCLSFEEEDDDSDKIIYANIQMNGYKFIIEYGLVGDILVNLEHYIQYQNDDSLFDISDIFTLFDIDDFKSYTFLENTENGMVDSAIDTLLDMMQKYDYDIRKAGESDNFKKLVDTKKEDAWKLESDKTKIRDAMHLGSAHTRYRRNPTEKNKQRYIKELENFESKGRLASEDKRLLDKLRSGQNIVIEQEQEDFDHRYRVANMIIIAIASVAIFIVCFAVYGILWYTRSKLGLLIVEPASVLAIIISAVAFSLGFDWGIAPRIAKKIVEKNGVKISKNIDQDIFRSKGQRFFAYHIAPIVLPIFGVITFIMGAPSTIMTDNAFVDYTFGTKNETPYSQLEIYSVEGQSVDDKFEKYDYPYYCFVEESGAVHEFGPVKKNDDIARASEIFEKNNITPTPIKTTDLLYDFE